MIIFKSEVQTSTSLTFSQEISPDHIGVFRVESGIISVTPEGMFFKLFEEKEIEHIYAGVKTYLNENLCVPGFTYPLIARNQIQIYATKHQLGAVKESLERTITICERKEE